MVEAIFDAVTHTQSIIEVPDANTPMDSVTQPTPPTIEERVAAVEETLTLLTEVIL